MLLDDDLKEDLTAISYMDYRRRLATSLITSILTTILMGFFTFIMISLVRGYIRNWSRELSIYSFSVFLFFLIGLLCLIAFIACLWETIKYTKDYWYKEVLLMPTKVHHKIIDSSSDEPYRIDFEDIIAEKDFTVVTETRFKQLQEGQEINVVVSKYARFVLDVLPRE